MEVKQWPVSNVTLGHFPKTRSEVVLQALCDMPADTPTVNRYERDERYPSSEERGWRKLPDPRGPALLMTMFELWAPYHEEKLAQTVGGLHEGKSRGGFSRDDLVPLWRLLDSNDVVTVRIIAWPRFANIVRDGEADLFGPDRGHWPGKKVLSSRYRLSRDEDGQLLIDGVAAPKPTDPGPTPEEQAAIDASDRQMAAEREAHERREQEIKDRAARENREHNERMEQERAERAEEQRRAQEEADARVAAERAENERLDREAAKERERLGIRGPDDIMKALSDPPSEDGLYLALVNLWSAQYAPDDTDGFKARLADIRRQGQFAPAVDEVCRRLGWSL